MISLDVKNDIAFIEINDGKANVIDRQKADAFLDALHFATTEAKATVISGVGEKFCAGFDLATIEEGGEPKTEMVLMGFDLLYRLYTHPQPLLAACNGHAIGLGAFILLCCDNRIGIDGDYKIGLPETAGRMPFPPFLVKLLREEMQRSFMTPVALQSQMIDPKTAIKAGFLDMLVAPDQLAAAAEKGASMLMTLPKTQYATNKLALRDSLIGEMRAQINELIVYQDLDTLTP